MTNDCKLALAESERNLEERVREVKDQMPRLAVDAIVLSVAHDIEKVPYQVQRPREHNTLRFP